MSASVGIRALQQNASAVIARVASGETVEVTDRGRLVARLVPVTGSAVDDLVRAGLARAPRQSVGDLPAALPAHDGSPTLGALLDDARADER
jgi:prevent-host-death family protein